MNVRESPNFPPIILSFLWETIREIRIFFSVIFFRKRNSKTLYIMVEIDERDGLARQNKDVLNLDTLAADTPEVISRQVLSAKILYV